MPDSKDRILKAYNEWAEIYDTNQNKTRDLNASVLREQNFSLAGKRVLEAGCGTGINSEYFAEHANTFTGIDLSEEMRNFTFAILPAPGDSGFVRLILFQPTLCWSILRIFPTFSGRLSAHWMYPARFTCLNFIPTDSFSSLRPGIPAGKPVKRYSWMPFPIRYLNSSIPD
jgi:SAM-dependent methyltransferase